MQAMSHPPDPPPYYPLVQPSPPQEHALQQQHGEQQSPLERQQQQSPQADEAASQPHHLRRRQRSQRHPQSRSQHEDNEDDHSDSMEGGEDRDHDPPQRLRVDGKEPTLELLQARYHIPLVDVAKEFRVSLTMMKRLCRKLGIQRWPHRQVRSLDKLLYELEERISATTSARELSYLQEQVALLEKKRRLVTRGASSGMHSALRNALFMAEPSTLLEEEELFDEDKLTQLDDALSKLPPSEQRKILHKGDSNPVLKIMTSTASKPTVKRKRVKSSVKAEKAMRALKQAEAAVHDHDDHMPRRAGPARGASAAAEEPGQRLPPTPQQQQQGGWDAGAMAHGVGSPTMVSVQSQGVPPQHHMHQPMSVGTWSWGYGNMAAAQAQQQQAAAAAASAGTQPSPGATGVDVRVPPEMGGYVYSPYHGDPNAAAARAAMMHHPHMHAQMMGMPPAPAAAPPHMFAPPTTIPYMPPVDAAVAQMGGADYPHYVQQLGGMQGLVGMGMYHGDGAYKLEVIAGGGGGGSGAAGDYQAMLVAHQQHQQAQQQQAQQQRAQLAAMMQMHQQRQGAGAALPHMQQPGMSFPTHMGMQAHVHAMPLPSWHTGFTAGSGSAVVPCRDDTRSTVSSSNGGAAGPGGVSGNGRGLRSPGSAAAALCEDISSDVSNGTPAPGGGGHTTPRGRPGTAVTGGNMAAA